jgi:hypothetical protein
MYTTINDVKNYALVEIEQSFETQITDWIIQVSKIMDKMANRRLLAPAEFYVRFYNGNNKADIRIDDCVEINRLRIGDQYGENFEEINSNQYVKYPQRSTSGLSDQEPHRRIFLKNDYFKGGIQNIEVRARWGAFTTLPADLKLACTILVAGIVINQSKGKQAQSSEKIGNYAVSYLTEQGMKDYKMALETINLYRNYDY